MFKKLATVVCATAMLLSTMTGIVANAAVSRDEGVNLVADKKADNEVTLKVYSVGYDSIRNYGLNFTVDGAVVSSVTTDFAALDGTKTNIYGNGGNVAVTGTSTEEVSLTNNLMFTLTLTLTADISKDITISLDDECTVKKGNKDTLEYYAEDYEDDPDSEYVTLGFNDAVVKAAPVPQTVPAAVTAVEKQNTEAISGTGKYEAQAADIYGVEITPNDESVSGATVSVGGKTKDISFKTVYSGEGTVVFAVILASESGDPLPALSADNVTPIVVAVD